VPKRHADLFAGIANFAALREAAVKAALGKRSKPGAAAFMANLETNLLRIERALLEERWQSGGYTEIELHDPKRRIVSAAPFRDRVVHHALSSFAVGGSALCGSLTARPMGVGCAATPETTTPGTPARRTATTTRPATGTTTASVSPARLHVPEPLFLRERRVCPKVSTGRHDECSTPPRFWLQGDRGFS
jgi:hypothetical protein